VFFQQTTETPEFCIYV